MSEQWTVHRCEVECLPCDHCGKGGGQKVYMFASQADGMRGGLCGGCLIGRKQYRVLSDWHEDLNGNRVERG